MASSVAHELNQPLTAINNYCSGMVTRIKDKKLPTRTCWAHWKRRRDRPSGRARSSSASVSSVKRSEPNRTLSDVPGMVAEAVELAEIEFRRRNVRLTYHIAHRAAARTAGRPDPPIEQVLVNLMKNAAESIDTAARPSARRNVELRVLPKIEEGLRAVEFSVTDTGQGLVHRRSWSACSRPSSPPRPKAWASG